MNIEAMRRPRFSGGSLASSAGRFSRDYKLAAGELRMIGDLGREVVGPIRDAFGDLRNAILDVEVLSGPGEVIPFLQSVDNGSSDTIVRID